MKIFLFYVTDTAPTNTKWFLGKLSWFMMVILFSLFTSGCLRTEPAPTSEEHLEDEIANATVTCRRKLTSWRPRTEFLPILEESLFAAA